MPKWLPGDIARLDAWKTCGRDDLQGCTDREVPGRCERGPNAALTTWTEEEIELEEWPSRRAGRCSACGAGRAWTTSCQGRGLLRREAT